MDPERWPDFIAELVAKMHCPRCGRAKGDKVMATVRYQHPVWFVIANCFGCGLIHPWQVCLDGLLPKPKPAPVENTPVPEWVTKL